MPLDAHGSTDTEGQEVPWARTLRMLLKMAFTSCTCVDRDFQNLAKEFLPF